MAKVKLDRKEKFKLKVPECNHQYIKIMYERKKDSTLIRKSIVCVRCGTIIVSHQDYVGVRALMEQERSQ